MAPLAFGAAAFLPTPLIDPDTNDYAWTTTLRLADVHQITVYDASYLELALRRGLPLATREDQLASAAANACAILLPTR